MTGCTMKFRNRGTNRWFLKVKSVKHISHLSLDDEISPTLTTLVINGVIARLVSTPTPVTWSGAMPLQNLEPSFPR